MDADEVKSRFQDIIPPDANKNPTELNKQNRKMLVNDPIEPSQTQPATFKPHSAYPLEIDRETIVDPMLAKPAQTETDQKSDKPDVPSSENIYKVSKPVAGIETEETVQPDEVAEEKQVPQTVETLETPVEAANEPEANPEPIDTESTTLEVGETLANVLPDPATRAANAVKDEMQEPRIYDTTAYHVPIKDTVHSHGGVKSALIFGVIFAIVVVGGLILVLSRFS